MHRSYVRYSEVSPIRCLRSTDPPVGRPRSKGHHHVAIVFQVTRSVEGIGALAGDLIVVDLEDEEFPISVVRAKPKAELVSVLRHLDSFKLLTPESSLLPLFGSVGLEPPRHVPERHAGGPAVPPEEEAS